MTGDKQSASGATALLVSYYKYLLTDGGGVQVCNREYLEALKRAGYELHTVSFDYPRDMVSRLRRRLSPEIWYTTAPAELLELLCQALITTKAQTIFFGHTMFADLSRQLRHEFPSVQQVLLSHGAEGLDFCIEENLRRSNATERHFRPVAERMIGRSILDQMKQRRCIDAVLTLSPFEVEIEKWFGATKALWVPRTIMESPLAMTPINQRVGCVSTLNHAPNFEGLIKVFEELEQRCSPEFRFRLVGSPSDVGDQLAKRFSFLDYLGFLPEFQLRTEAATWCCFVNPIFEYAKGCSTKLAVALGWGLPIATTEYGARGYCWDVNQLPLARSPAELAEFVLERAVLTSMNKYQQQSAGIKAQTPDIQAIGNQIRAFLNRVRNETPVTEDFSRQLVPSRV
jgi:hypothetical protein